MFVFLIRLYVLYPLFAVFQKLVELKRSVEQAIPELATAPPAASSSASELPPPSPLYLSMGMSGSYKEAVS